MKKHKKQPMNKLHVYTNFLHYTVVDLFDLVYIYCLTTMATDFSIDENTSTAVYLDYKASVKT